MTDITRELSMNEQLHRLWIEAEQMISYEQEVSPDSGLRSEWDSDEMRANKITLGNYGLTLKVVLNEAFNVTSMKATIDDADITSDFELAVRQKISAFAERYCLREKSPPVAVQENHIV